MSCTHLKTCYEVGTTYKDKFLNIPDSLDGLTDFRYVVKSALGATLLTLSEGNGIEKLGNNNLCIQSAQLQDLDPGTYSTTLFYKLNGNDRKLFTETLEISIDGCDCANIYNLSFTIIPVDISENVVNIYLSWEDLTPEQILELQQPAIDAGNEVITQTNLFLQEKDGLITTAINNAENATHQATTAAGIATTAAQSADEKATAAQTAANNANAAKNAAETATQEANDATAAANTATTNANNATTAANTAAENAQSEADAAQQINTNIQNAENTRISNETTRQNQESGRVTSETDRATAESNRAGAESSRVTAESSRATAETTRQSNETTRQNQESTRQTNETGRVNAESARVTAESSRVTAESGRVTAESARVANDANRLAVVASYTHSGNKEVVVSSFSGNTMTSVGHGLANGDRLAVTLTTSASNNGTAGILNTVPILAQMPISISSVGFYVVNITTDTFQLSLTAGGSALNVNPAADFTLYKFEIPTPLILPFTSLPASNSYRVLINGGIFKEPSYIYVNGNNVTVGSFTDSQGQLISTTAVYNNAYLLGNIDISVRATRGVLIINRRRELIYWNTSGNLTNESGNSRIVHFSNKTPITALQMQLVAIANGAQIKIIRE